MDLSKIIDQLTSVQGAAAVGAVVAAISSLLNRGQIHKVHVQFNSRISQLLEAKDALAKAALELAAASAHAAGIEKGRAQKSEENATAATASMPLSTTVTTTTVSEKRSDT